MINDASTVAADRLTPDFTTTQKAYLDALKMLERLHRRLLDVLKDEFDRQGRDDINSVQALLLFNIGDNCLTAAELRTRGYYLGSNVSYNIKKLTELGFIKNTQSSSDRRSIRISLTEKGLEAAKIVSALYTRHIASINVVGGIGTRDLRAMNQTMQRMDDFWNDTIMYRL